MTSPTRRAAAPAALGFFLFLTAAGTATSKPATAFKAAAIKAAPNVSW